MPTLWTNGWFMGAVVLLIISTEFAFSFIVAYLQTQSTFRLAALWAIVQPTISFCLILSTAKHVGIINILIGWGCTFATLTAFNMVVFSVGRQDTSTTINGIPVFETVEGIAKLSIFWAVVKLLHWHSQRKTSLFAEFKDSAVALYDQVVLYLTLQNIQ
ncbi:hypothetical protein SLS58_002844 [Diplodia intermedia]|uniref:Uncharacterized protein n=1 Tax=Diplodia intermedia TaxID=856260 RepID=A0ABR3TYK3_9PEZI